MRVVTCFLRELCLFYKLERRSCPWAPDGRNSLWHDAGHVPGEEEDSNRGAGLAVSEVDAFPLNM